MTMPDRKINPFVTVATFETNSITAEVCISLVVSIPGCFPLKFG